MKLETRNLKPENRFSPAISVIVPIYNMEKLMRKCLDSILAQTFQDYECLLIDDGSKDGSPAICDEYAAKDRRFKAFHKPNGGLSDARNYGLARAKGEYTIFFDPDDWVDEDCLKDMYEKAQETNADMVICDFFNEDKYQQRVVKHDFKSLSHIEVLERILNGSVMGSTCNKLLRKEVYYSSQAVFPNNIYGCEDQYTMCKLLKNDIKIGYLSKAYYHYMHYGNDSQSRKYDLNVYRMDLHIRDMFVSLFKGTRFEQLAFDSKSSYILHRAFIYGQSTFSSKDFKRLFSSYKYLIGSQMPSYFVFFYHWSLVGHYQTARRLFSVLYSLKQYIKKYKAIKSI